VLQGGGGKSKSFSFSLSLLTAETLRLEKVLIVWKFQVLTASRRLGSAVSDIFVW
jgi:hypothetical protein